MSPASVASAKTRSISTACAGRSASRRAARAARKRRCSVGSSSTERDEQPARRPIRLARERAPAGLLERAGGAPRRARRARRRRAPPSSVAAWSRWYARISTSSSPATLVHPVGDLLVQLGARALGEPGVGDVADQDVLEAVGALARDRRAALAGEEVAQEQVVEHRLEILDLGQQVRRPRPPRRSGRSPRRAAAAASRSAAAGRCGPRSSPAACRGSASRGAALEQHPRRLLDEERVALGLLEQRLALRGRELAVGEQRVEQLLALGGRQRLELDRRGAERGRRPSSD